MDAFTRAYVEAMLWAENDNADPETGGEPLDKNYSADDLAPETLARVETDCKAFQEKAGDLIRGELCNYKGCAVEAYAGHDFWLTRRGHGCGFWDGDWKEPAEKTLTALAKSFGDLDVYVGDDGKLYF